MEAFTMFGAVSDILFAVLYGPFILGLTPFYWVFVGLECLALTSWRKGLSQTGTFAFLVSAQVLSPFSYFLFLSIVPGSDKQGTFFHISDREENAGLATAALCFFLFVSSVVILYLRGKNFRQRF